MSEEAAIAIKFTSASFAVFFDTLHAGQTYHQSVLASITNNVELDHLRTHIKRAAEAATSQELPNPPRFPHLSLFYGNLPMDVKAALIHELYNSGLVTALDRSGVRVAGIESCLIDEVWLVRTEGRVQDWVVLAKHALG